MINIFSPSQARIPIGTATIAGKSYEVVVNIEWAKYFDEMTKALNAATLSNESASNGIDGPAVGVMSDGGHGGDVEFIPGPQGIQGRRGDTGPAIGFLLSEDATPEFIPGPPGPKGSQGNPGPALFMLQEESSEQTLMLPPAQTLASLGAAALAGSSTQPFAVSTLTAASTITSTTGVFNGNGSVVVTALATATTFPGISATAGVLRIRDNTLGGSSLWLIDPNGGPQLIGVNQITGLTVTNGGGGLGFAWQANLSAGAVPRSLVFTLYG